jgi:site-specific DNA recombinase
MMMNCAALYVRTATVTQTDDGRAVDRQLDHLRNYCSAHGCAAAHIYSDAGYSGADINRPGLNALIRDIAAYDTVLVCDLSRLSRRPEDTLHLIKDVFEPAGVTLVSLSEKLDAVSIGEALIRALPAAESLPQ